MRGSKQEIGDRRGRGNSHLNNFLRGNLGDTEVTIGVEANVLRSPLGVPDGNRPFDVVRQSVGIEGDHGGVNVAEESGAPRVIQNTLEPLVFGVSSALLHYGHR